MSPVHQRRTYIARAYFKGLQRRELCEYIRFDNGDVFRAI